MTSTGMKIKIDLKVWFHFYKIHYFESIAELAFECRLFSGVGGDFAHTETVSAHCK